ncbi:MAG: right-handed parallel beta-helix repeat-containing protein, partial [Paramuribaculum sp.]|nr:right-handed parallel beta-helix repeat-containing protein [Paramuribaculum sp.]
MKAVRRQVVLVLAVAVGLIGSAHTADTIRVSDFSMRPYAFENCVTNLQAAIDSCRSNPGSVLLFEPGRYDIWPEGAVREEIYISNTSSEVECPSKVKTIGVYLKELENVTIEGNGSTLMMHGSITPVAISNSKGIEIKNLNVDFERPAASELTYVMCEPGRVVMKVHKDTRYVITDGHVNLIGEGWVSKKIHCIKYNPSDKHSTYSGDWNILQSCRATEIEPGTIAFATPKDFAPEVGTTLTLRDIIRSQVGTLILESRDVKFRDVNMRFMHGLGIVSQYSHNITMERVNCRPDEKSGRLLASSADFMHFSGCSGAVKVTDCSFAGSHDDAINVHGTNLRVEEIMDATTVRLRFMHHQTYGLNAFHPGDTVTFVNPATMLRSKIAVVKSVEKINPRNLAVTLDRAIPK